MLVPTMPSSFIFTSHDPSLTSSLIAIMAPQTRKTARLSLVASSSDKNKKKTSHPDNVVMADSSSSSSPAIKRRRLLDDSFSSSSSPTKNHNQNQNQKEKASAKDNGNESTASSTNVDNNISTADADANAAAAAADDDDNNDNNDNDDNDDDDEDEDDFYHGDIPTIEMIETKLFTIGCSSKYSKNEIIQALKDLYSLVNIKYVYDWNSSFCLAKFPELGMLSRVLLFLKNNIDDASYCYHATELIHMYLHANDRISPIKMSNTFIQRGGIQILVLANDAYVKKGKTTSQLRALTSIWKTLMLSLFFSLQQTMGEEVVPIMLDQNQCISIFESSIKTMNMLKSDNVGVSYSGEATQPDGGDDVCDSSQVATYVFKTLNFLIDLKGITVNDIIGKNYFEEYVGFLMKDPARIKSNDFGVWLEATSFFIACFKQNILSKETKLDVKVLLPFCVECIKKILLCNNMHNLYFCRSTCPISLLWKVSTIIGKKTTRKTPGLMTTLGTLVDSNTTDIDQLIKEKTYKLLSYLCNV